MPGFLGGGTSSGGVSGEIKFAKEFIDPVTKLRVSEPENLIDTDFEYGLQPTKWETVELINNTPSFFSKSGDTTIDGISSVTTNAGTREITVKTALEHGLAVGIPIQVTGTKSLTADGSYIINSIPDDFTFTYLCRDNQENTAAIEDLYTSIITGEFFQGSQLRISDADGIVTDAGSTSILTVTTESTHGFNVKTPFYFLNLNSTISQDFPAANTTTKSFDASNSATAQTFDGSNTLSSISIDLSNSAVIGGATSSISSTDPANNTITVSHGTENFASLTVGTPLYYNVLASSGFFAANPRGVVFLKSTNGNGTIVSAFSVSEVPDGPEISIEGNMSGTFQIANQARTFAGNNVNPATEIPLTVINDPGKQFDAENSAGTSGEVVGYSGSNITLTSPTELGWYPGTMVFYTTDGTAATGLTNNTTYWIDLAFRQGSTDFYSATLKATPDGAVISGLSGGSGTQTLTQIGMSLDKDVFHLRDHGFDKNDMLRYDYPVGGHFGSDQVQDFYYVQTVYDAHNFALTHSIGEISPTSVEFVGTDAGTAVSPQAITITGFVEPYTWAVTSGVLPTGLSLNATTGVVSGTPSEVIDPPGRDVEVTITDAESNFAVLNYKFQFNQPPELYSFTSATFGQDNQRRTGENLTRQRQLLGSPSWANDTNYLSQPWYVGYNLWTVPSTATYRFRVAGAAGSRYWGYTYGRGAVLQGDIALQQGDYLFITVGSTADSRLNGGGMSVVARWTSGNYNTSVPLIVSGGGGSYYTSSDSTHQDANPSSTTPNSTEAFSYWGYTYQVGAGGTGYDAGPGGGFFRGYDYNPRGAFGNRWGRGWRQGGEGGYDQGNGGFGGGGGYHSGYNDGGGGGGYSGGSGGGPWRRNGTGGSSYFDSSVTNRYNSNGSGFSVVGSLGFYNNGVGYVQVTKL